MNYIICQATGKIILSGEYAVVFGYAGIAVPAPCGVIVTWEEKACHPERRRRATRTMSWFVSAHHDTLTISYRGIENENYLHRILDAITAKVGPLSGHLTIENTIPIGRGMGSSTALVITIVRCLAEKFTSKERVTLSGDEGRHAMCHGSSPLTMTHCQSQENNIKEIALSIEDTVNPGHSGLDFAVIWNEKPILFRKGRPPEFINIPIYQYMDNSLLIDTGKPSETTPEMVAWVKNRNQQPATSNALQTIAHCTERLLAGESPLAVFPDHHRAQVALGVVPEPVQALVANIEKIGGAAKVVGAGGRTSGGGIVLALHQNPEKLLTLAKQHEYAVFRIDMA